MQTCFGFTSAGHFLIYAYAYRHLTSKQDIETRFEFTSAGHFSYQGHMSIYAYVYSNPDGLVFILSVHR